MADTPPCSVAEIALQMALSMLSSLRMRQKRAQIHGNTCKFQLLERLFKGQIFLLVTILDKWQQQR
jgi:hypothetical protein